MLIRIGYEMVFDVPAPVPMVLCCHPPRAARPRSGGPAALRVEPGVPLESTSTASATAAAARRPGRAGSRLWDDLIVEDSGLPDPVAPRRLQHPVADLPTTCWSTCWPAATARSTGSPTSPGSSSARPPRAGAGSQAVCDWVHQTSSSATSSPGRPRRPTTSTRSGHGVCRDFTHLALTFCRCMNIPARYATGYLGDIGVPPPPRRWTSAAGSRRTSTAAGTPSTPGTTCPGSAGSSWPAAATPWTWP